MTELFLHVVNLSISASWLILAVLLARVVMRRAPKWAHVLLWGLVGIRLVCPISLESIWSLIPSAQTISPTLLTDSTPTVQTGFPTLNQTINPVLSQAAAATPDATPNLLEIWLPTLASLWVLGMVVWMGYAAVGYLHLRRSLSNAVEVEDHIFQSPAAHVPFVLGLFHPNIYLPHSMDPDTLSHVIAHEQAHLKRRDHWWKALGFLLLCIHWFNPLVWVAYGTFCRDVELACDEAVVKHLDHQARADYSQALLLCSVGRASWKAGPLCFGEVGVKHRVKAVLRYRRPALTTVAASVLLCALVGVAFLTNPIPNRSFPMDGSRVSDLNPQWIIDEITAMEGLKDGTPLCINGNQIVYLTSNFEIRKSGEVSFFYVQKQRTYRAQLKMSAEEETYSVTAPTSWPWQNTVFSLQSYLDALKHLPQEEIRRLAPDADLYSVTMVESGTPDDWDRTITYTSQGAGAIDGWYIHLQVQPFYENEDSGYHGTGEDVIHLFYGGESSVPAGTYVGTDIPGTLVANDIPGGLDSPYLSLSGNGTFFWSPALISSAATIGLYEQTDDGVILYTNEGHNAYVFRKVGDTLVYDPDASTPAQTFSLEDWAFLP